MPASTLGVRDGVVAGRFSSAMVVMAEKEGEGEEVKKPFQRIGISNIRRPRWRDEPSAGTSAIPSPTSVPIAECRESANLLQVKLSADLSSSPSLCSYNKLS